jgi:hypothetical protein
MTSEPIANDRNRNRSKPNGASQRVGAEVKRRTGQRGAGAVTAVIGRDVALPVGGHRPRTWHRLVHWATAVSQFWAVVIVLVQ